MNTQFDHSLRTVSLENLRAMCERISGVCHTYSIVKVSRSRVHVEYSNPDEYGFPEPVTAIYPCIPNPYRAEPDNPAVIIGAALRYIGDYDGYGCQAFDSLTECPTLWRTSEGTIRPTGDWHSHAEILARDGDTHAELRPDTCTVCDLPKGKE